MFNVLCNNKPMFLNNMFLDFFFIGKVSKIVARTGKYNV